MAEGLQESAVEIDTPDRRVDAFRVFPQGASGAPAPVVAQEAFGVNAHIRDLMAFLAACRTDAATSVG